MPSKTTRIAYLKRMLRRLEGEDARVQQLVTAGSLSAQGAKLTMSLVKKSRQELRDELNRLEGIGDGASVISTQLA
jgi:hypothetical protein